MLFHRVEDLAVVDKVRYTGPPPRVNTNPTAQGAGNPVVLSAYTFLPRKYLSDRKLPLIVRAAGPLGDRSVGDRPQQPQRHLRPGTCRPTGAFTPATSIT
jgi:hypothetical protein